MTRSLSEGAGDAPAGQSERAPCDEVQKPTVENAIDVLKRASSPPPKKPSSFRRYPDADEIFASAWAHARWNRDFSHAAMVEHIHLFVGHADHPDKPFLLRRAVKRLDAWFLTDAPKKAQARYGRRDARR